VGDEHAAQRRRGRRRSRRWGALGVGFDLHAEYATWLQLRTLYSQAAQPAVFCELVAPVTTRVVTGERPALRADLPPAELLAACQSI
jgi:hypothetical protein